MRKSDDMKKMPRIMFVVLLSLSFLYSFPAEAAKPFKVPSSVASISKENTYPNASQDQPLLQPSELTAELFKTTSVPIENTHLIKMLNESSISGTPLAVGYRATIFLGRWALSYDSNETVANWEYKK